MPTNPRYEVEHIGICVAIFVQKNIKKVKLILLTIANTFDIIIKLMTVARVFRPRYVSIVAA